jgi:GT2 family glycosyltransferase
VILNWNGKKFLEKFLPDVILHSKDDAEVIVADNASSDDSVSYLKEAFPDIRVIINDKNYGFAEGYNRALAQVEADYYVLLNSDIEVTRGWISPVIQFMETDPGIAACQPKILSYHRRQQFEYAGAAGGFIDKYGYPFCRGRLFQYLEDDKGQYDDPAEVFWATGACMFVRAPLYHEFGGLDGDFFAHMEEIDFCWRLKNHHYKIMYFPGSTVYHVGGGTLPKVSSRKTYLNFRNNMTLLYKNVEQQRLLKVYIARVFLDGVASVKFLLEGHVKDFYAVLRAHCSFYRNLAKIRKKRKSLPQQKPTKLFEGNIAFEHFIKRKKRFTELSPDKFSS